MISAGFSLRSLTVRCKLLLYFPSIRQGITSGFASHNSDKYQSLWSEDLDSIYCYNMPKNKDYSSSDASSHSSSEDEKPKKKQRTEKSKDKEETAESSKKTKGSSKANEEEPHWELGNNKRVTVRHFKGKLYVDIREYYEKEGEMKPTKKGVSMGLPQFTELMTIINEVEDVVKIKSGN
ncbi:activated RNA polymerase II transcriptional coactivator p15 [Diachasma alloeum]|uniref:activated RNA polymerase II transcriptional coactivator p15 n=1 Tax=Diachasma alloeum TaxID=454923 RepID=UPI0007383C3B|nr:activated RNA polymerase II transcriptional coactivator p15 [Diachasma alloeum]